MRTEHRAIVLGQGGIGSAAAYWLSLKHGGDVLTVDRFGPGHDRGGSQDHTRIVRRSYHDAFTCGWNEVETAGGRELAVRTGGLDLPGSHTDVRYAKTCLYTLTPDRDFIIGPSPESSRIFMAVGAGTPSSSLR